MLLINVAKLCVFLKHSAKVLPLIEYTKHFTEKISEKIYLVNVNR